VVADVRDLPFEPGSVRELYAAHVIEHFPLQEAERVLLPHWRRVLAPGGRLVIVCPDWEAMLEAHAAGQYSYDDLRLVTFGAQEYEGDTHFNMYTPSSLTALCERVGFTAVTVKDKARRNGACFEMEIEAVR
jgi:predicted SAM-dependent methyltransferase